MSRYNDLLQTKIYQLLSADTELVTTLGCQVLDHVPDNTEAPYIVIGDDSFDDFGAHDVDGFKVDVTIHTWVESKGKKTCKQIQARIYELLHDVDLAITGQKTITMRTGLQTTLLDPDGRTYHGVNKFNLILGG